MLILMLDGGYTTANHIILYIFICEMFHIIIRIMSIIVTAYSLLAVGHSPW